MDISTYSEEKSHHKNLNYKVYIVRALGFEWEVTSKEKPNNIEDI
jgi:hypothetical protein